MIVEAERYDEPLWLKIYVAPLENLAMSTDLPAYHRLHLLALARAEPNGHAEFKTGVLARLMGKDGQPHHDIGAAVHRGIETGLLHPSSMSTCLVLPEKLAQPYGKTKRAKFLKCMTHHGERGPLITAWVCEHSDRKHKAHGLCDSCYRIERSAAKIEGCTPWWERVRVPDSPTHPRKSGHSGEYEGEMTG